MIAHSFRFHGHGGLKRVYQQGSTVRGPQANLKYMWRGGNKPYRLAVVVSKKVSKSAVVRNRIRRRVYELVRQNNTPLPNGFDAVIILFDETAATQDHDQLNTTIQTLLKKALRTKSEHASTAGASRDIVKPNGIS